MFALAMVAGELTSGVAIPFPTVVGGTAATLDIDFIGNRAFNGGLVSIASLLACARTSDGYYLKADGTLVNGFGNNVLRYGSSGLLVEEARTNIVLQSQTLATSPWSDLASGANATAANATATAPDGTLTACTLTDTTANNFHTWVQSLTVSASLPYTFSAYVKFTNHQFIAVRMFDGASLFPYITYDLINGTITNTQAGIAGTIKALANGWFFITATITTGVSAGAGNVLFAFSNSSAYTGATYVGTGTDTFLVWGAQQEQAAFASSYIPTTTVSASRAADVVTFSSLTWMDGTSESILAKWIAANRANACVMVFGATNNVTLNEQSGMSPELSDAGATVAIVTANTVAAGALAKAAGRMKTNDYALCLNAGTVGTDVVATQIGTVTSIRLGIDLAGANALNSYITRVAAWKTLQLTNANLQTLTT